MTATDRHSLTDVDLDADPPTATCAVCGPGTRLKVRERQRAHTRTTYLDRQCYNKYRENLDRQPSKKSSKLEHGRKKGYHSLVDIDFAARTAECALCGPGAKVFIQRAWTTDELSARCASGIAETEARHHDSGPCSACGHASPHSCVFRVLPRDRDPENTHPDNRAVYCLTCWAEVQCQNGMRYPDPSCPTPRVDPSRISSWDKAGRR